MTIKYGCLGDLNWCRLRYPFTGFPATQRIRMSNPIRRQIATGTIGTKPSIRRTGHTIIHVVSWKQSHGYVVVDH